MEEKEKSDDVTVEDEAKPQVANKDTVEDENTEEVEEFDDEELDEGTDYLKDYFDGGEDYLDDDDDHDEGPCY